MLELHFPLMAADTVYGRHVQEVTQAPSPVEFLRNYACRNVPLVVRGRRLAQQLRSLSAALAVSGCPSHISPFGVTGPDYLLREYIYYDLLNLVLFESVQ